VKGRWWFKAKQQRHRVSETRVSQDHFNSTPCFNPAFIIPSKKKNHKKRFLAFFFHIALGLNILLFKPRHDKSKRNV